MIDLGLIALARKAVASKPRDYITPSILLAVVMQESGGCPYFIDTKPGSLYHLNVGAACKYFKKRRKPDGSWETLGPFFTGFKPNDIRQMITVPDEIDGWRVPQAMRGHLAKFRFEYGYWERFNNLGKTDRFYMSCSWGLVQFMGPNISKQGDIGFIKRFAADVPLQLLYGAGMVDDLLTNNHGDLVKAYKAYNSGNPNSTRRDVIDRAEAVARRALEIELELKRRGA